jgi:hypothetical protein
MSLSRSATTVIAAAAARTFLAASAVLSQRCDSLSAKDRLA